MIGLEHLADGSTADRNFQALMRLVLDTGGQSLGIRFGTATLTWPGGAAFSDFPSVTHGLGRTPQVVGAFANGGLTGSKRVVVTAYAYTSTAFTVDGVTDDRSNPAAASTLNVRWVAIG